MVKSGRGVDTPGKRSAMMLIFKERLKSTSPMNHPFFQTPFFQWIDLLWIPIVLLGLHKEQKVCAVVFVLACVVLLRFQVELMQQIGYPNGILPLLETPLFVRGLISYSVFTVLFILISRLSPGTNKHVYVAASITLFFAAFFVSSIAMIF